MLDCDPVKIPSDPNQKLTRDMSPSSTEQIEQMSKVPYEEAVGSILYLTQCTRPDLAFSVANVSHTAYWKAVKRILRYLKGTMDYKLTFNKRGTYNKLCGFADADWGSSFCDFRSCTGYVFLWQGGAISWLCKKQPTVALSTTESEYMSLSCRTRSYMANPIASRNC